MNKKYIYLLFLFSFVDFNSGGERSAVVLNPIESLSIQDSVISRQTNGMIAIVGDLQRTTTWELMMGREQNEPERKKIIQNIALENPVALILLGDMVSNGSDLKEWDYLRDLLIPVKNKNIPIIPTLGNHEYWGDDSVALYYAGQSFPIFKESHWYIKIYGDLVFVILDSNRDDLMETAWSKERKWFTGILNYYDSEQSIEGIIVCLHHPPYTNSIVTGDNENVQEAFLQPFLNSEKTLAMISGHAHTYERFREKGKMFIVSGGGGGPRILLKTGLNIHKDLVDLPSVRPFSYLLLHVKPGGIEITARGLNKDSSKFFTIDKFTIPFNNF
jgi:Icc-related predicted phosphoesterase